MKRIRTLSLVAVLMAITPGCGTSYYPVNTSADAKLIAESYSPAAVRAAIIRALDNRRFATESEVAGQITARHEKGDRRVRVRIDYKGTEYSVHYLDSVGYEFNPETNPKDLVIENRYHKLVKQLKKVIGDELKRPAKEQAAAARAERDYQLLLERTKAGQNAPAPAPPPEKQGGLLPIPIPIPLPQGNVTVEDNKTIKKSDTSLTCCINGAKYTCNTREEFDKCSTLQPHNCSAAGSCQ